MSHASTPLSARRVLAAARLGSLGVAVRRLPRGAANPARLDVVVPRGFGRRPDGFGENARVP